MSDEKEKANSSHDHKKKRKLGFFKNPDVVKSIILNIDSSKNVSAKNKLVRSYFDGLF